ncbi:unnamed protein product [Leptosia nina]|uniref:Coiled-coil domain-containing protein 34 n=1 Tax=Leptosia nina TaxID=320188 RepID=A0AAV1K3M6_9NEOP
MASDIEKGDFGDCARHKSRYDLSATNSNHIFDGAGENIQYHSDSESTVSKRSRTRYINPAIYIETVEASHSVTSLQTDTSCHDEVTPHPHSSYRSNSTPFLTGRLSSASSGSVKRKSCRLAQDIEKDIEEETPRCDHTFRDADGADTFRLSVSSLSTTTTAKEEREKNEMKRREAFKQWLERKEQEKREKLRQEKLKNQSTPTTTQEQREASYRRWLERKRVQVERQKAEEIMRKYRETERLEQERNRRKQDKEEKLAEWIRKKEEAIKSKPDVTDLNK